MAKKSQPPAPLVADLRSATRELSDVTLSSGLDGGSVPAARFLLAARSRVFRSMLLGRFSEAEQGVVILPYEKEVLEALVHYCATDDMLTFEYLSDEDEARVLVGIVAAAHFYELPALEGMARRCCMCVMEDRPPLACVVLEQTSASGGGGSGNSNSLADSSSGARGELESKEASTSSRVRSLGDCGPASNLRRRAMDVIRYRTREALLPDDRTHGRGAALLSATSLREVVSDELIHANEATLFRCIRRWVDAGSGDGGSETLSPLSAPEARGSATASSATGRPSPPKRSRKECDGDASTSTGGEDDSQDRVRVAKSIVAQSIRLSRIPPSELRRLVADSGLVTSSDLSAAFEAQALRAELRGHIFSEPRSTVQRKGRIVLRGAGVTALNGEFFSAGTSDEVPKYQRSCRYQGKDVTFTMLRFRSDDGTRRWYISIVPTNHEPGDDDHDFYYSDSDYDTPFCLTWKRKDYGENPSPVCKWEPDDFDDDLPLRV